MSQIAAASSPIVVLDSGLGGLTVVRELRKALPREDVVYFGDTARLPYGSKSQATVATFVSQIVRYLLPLGPKHVVIACNTATALALPEVRKEFPGLTFSGVIEPGAQAAIDAAGQIEEPIIGIIATEATVRSQAYEKAIHKRRMKARLLLQPAPLLVPIIEDGRTQDDPLVQLALKQYLAPLISRNIDVLVLGCTHYPILRGAIEKLVGARTPGGTASRDGGGVAVVDSARQCAQDVASRLAAAGLLRPTSLPSDSDGSGSDTGGTLRCWVTDEPPRFARLASRFLGHDVPKPMLVPPDELPTSSPVDALRRAV